MIMAVHYLTENIRKQAIISLFEQIIHIEAFIVGYNPLKST